MVTTLADLTFHTEASLIAAFTKTGEAEMVSFGEVEPLVC